MPRGVDVPRVGTEMGRGRREEKGAERGRGAERGHRNGEGAEV